MRSRSGPGSRRRSGSSPGSPRARAASTGRRAGWLAHVGFSSLEIPRIPWCESAEQAAPCRGGVIRWFRRGTRRTDRHARRQRPAELRGSTTTRPGQVGDEQHAGRRRGTAARSRAGRPTGAAARPVPSSRATRHTGAGARRRGDELEVDRPDLVEGKPNIRSSPLSSADGMIGAVDRPVLATPA